MLEPESLGALPGSRGCPRMRSRGGARLKAIVWLLIVGSGIYAGAKVVPIYFANYQLQDKMQTEARFAMVNHRTNEEVRDVIYREIQDRDIPAHREDIHVESSQRGVQIKVDYTVTVDLRVYQFNMHFTPSVQSDAL
jgi:hypothetical protein